MSNRSAQLQHAKRATKYIGTTLFGIMLGIFLTSLLGNPIDTFLHPPVPNVTVEQLELPLFRNDDYYARYYIYNNGDNQLNNIFVDYSFKCINKTGRATLDRINLNPGERTYFDVKLSENINVSCDYQPTYQIDFYRSGLGKDYVACGETVRDVCLCCFVEVNVSVSEIDDIKTFNFCYPFFEGDLSLIIDENCVTKEQIIKNNLSLVPEKTIMISPFDLWTPCISGIISMKWCKEHGYI